eukprot:2901130-Karenia_brevis.AAC.1
MKDFNTQGLALHTFSPPQFAGLDDPLECGHEVADEVDGPKEFSPPPLQPRGRFATAGHASDLLDATAQTPGEEAKNPNASHLLNDASKDFNSQNPPVAALGSAEYVISFNAAISA